MNILRLGLFIGAFSASLASAQSNPEQTRDQAKKETSQAPTSDPRDVRPPAVIKNESTEIQGTVAGRGLDCPAGFTRNTKATTAEECVPIAEHAAPGTKKKNK